MAEKVIFSLGVDQSSFTKEMANLNGEMDKLIAKRKELSKAGKASSEEYAENEALIRNLRGQQKELNTTLDQSIKMFNSSKGSINALDAELKLLTKQYNALSDEQKNSEDIGGEMQKRILGLTENLKAQKAALGDNKMNVGNYSASITDALKNQNLFGGQIGKIVSHIKDMKETLKTSKEGFETASAGAGKLKIALVSTGIGAIVVILGSLVAMLQETEEGSEFLGRSMKALGAVFKVVIGFAVDIGKKIVAAFENPKQALKDLGQLLIDQIVNRFKAAFGILKSIVTLDFDGLKESAMTFATGAENVGSKLEGMAGQMIEAAKSAYELEGKFQDLEDAERDYQKTQADTEALVDRLITQSKNQSKSIQERIGLLKQADEAERASHKQAEELAMRRVKLIEEQNANLEKTGQLRDEDRQTLVDAQKAYSNIQRDSLVLEEKIQNRKDALMQQEQERIKAALEKRKQLEEKAAQDREKRIQVVHENDKREVELMEDGIAKEMALLAIQTEQELEKARQTGESKELIVKLYQKRILDIQKTYAEKEVELQKKRVEDFKQLTEKEYADAQKVTGDYFTQLQTQRLNDQSAGILTKEESALREKQIEITKLESLIQLAKDYGQNTVELENQLAQKKAEIGQTTADRQLAIDKARFDQQVKMAQDVADAMGSIISSSYDQMGFNFQKFKKNFIIGILDMIRKVVNAQIASASAQSLAQPDSVATFGASGAIRAALLTGLINAAFEVAKAEISRAAGGGDFVTSGPTLMMVGDNPGGRERVTVEPLSGHGQTYVSPTSGLTHFAGGGTMTVDGGAAARGSSGVDLQASIAMIGNIMEKLPAPILRVSDFYRVENKTAEVKTFDIN